MENGQNINALEREHSLALVPLDHGDHAKSIDDILSRRIKNRDRQRRYRARKRLEAHTKKAYPVNNPPPLQIEMHVNGVPNISVTRVHCRRNWKKDARRAHILTEQEAILNGERRAIPGRRRWKVDARNKKNLSQVSGQEQLEHSIGI